MRNQSSTKKNLVKIKRAPSSEKTSSDEASVDDGGESIAEEESEQEVEADYDLDASSTEEDEDSDDDKNNKEDKIRDKYNRIKGTRLYVRFPHKVPLDDKEFENKWKSLSPLIIAGHKARQKHARFCYVDFINKEDRDTALIAIEASIKNDKSFEGIVVSIPKTESEDFVETLVVRKQKSLENKKTKLLMRKATKKLNRKPGYTSSIVVQNLPNTASVAEVRKLFSNAVDIQMKRGKGKYRDFNVATVTLPTTYDARMATKTKQSISGTNLMIRFNNTNTKKSGSKKKLKRKAERSDITSITTNKVVKAD